MKKNNNLNCGLNHNWRSDWGLGISKPSKEIKNL